MKIELHTNEEKWLEARKLSLGGSDQASRLLHKGDTYYWLRKNPAAREKFAEEIAAEDEREWGQAKINREARKAMEPVIERWLSAEKEVEIVDPGDYCILRSEADPRWHYSPDGLVLSLEGHQYDRTAGFFGGLSEHDREYIIKTWRIGGLDNKNPRPPSVRTEASYKTISPFARWKWDDEPDLFANLQIQSLYAWPDAPAFDPVLLAAFVGYGDADRDRLVYEVEPNPELIEFIQETTDRFWRYVEEDKPPPPDGFDSTKRSLDIIYRAKKKKRGATITLGTPWIAKDLEHQRLAKKIDKLEREKKRIEQEFAAEMGEHEASLAAVPADEHQPGRTWQRIRVEVSDSLCDCGAVKRKGYTFTRTEALK